MSRPRDVLDVDISLTVLFQLQWVLDQMWRLFGLAGYVAEMLHTR